MPAKNRPWMVSTALPPWVKDHRHIYLGRVKRFIVFYTFHSNTFPFIFLLLTHHNPVLPHHSDFFGLDCHRFLHYGDLHCVVHVSELNLLL